MAVADRLLHQAEARPGRGGERLRPGEAAAEDGVRAGDLVLLLQEAELRMMGRVDRSLSEDLGRGADRITGEEGRAGLDRAEEDGLVSLDESLGHQ